MPNSLKVGRVSNNLSTNQVTDVTVVTPIGMSLIQNVLARVDKTSKKVAKWNNQRP